MRFYEDLAVGETETLGSDRVSKAEILEFASQYDPQPFHLDEEAAEDSIFGELVASGWHTGAICMRLVVENQEPIATLAGVGIDDLRWHAPVTPGDVIHVHAEVVDKRTSDRHDDRGYVTRRVEGFDQDGDRLISYEATALIERREHEPADE